MADPRYPIGRHTHPESVTPVQRARFIDDIGRAVGVLGGW